MLTELHIENLGVIERVDLVLGEGLTAITGETGAGKTMLVEALDLVVGGRADPIAVRTGPAEARVDARFVAGDDEIVLTRVVPARGRSRAYVDGRPTTAAALAELAADLVDLHGQHAHQRLLGAATQRAALDDFGGVDLTHLRAARARLTEVEAELAALGGDERTRARELDLARFQRDELDAAAIDDADEDAALDAEEDVLADAVAHRDAGARAYDALTAEQAARDSIVDAASAVGARGPYRDVADRLDALLAELDDLASTLRDTVEDITQDPERLETVRARRQQLRDLCRKYGDDLAEVMRFHAEVASRVAELESYEERAAALDDARHMAVAAERRTAEAVGSARRSAAPRLALAVTERLANLAMSNAVVAVSVGEPETDPPGDQFEFLLAANPGSPALPLARVASGGELARTMLALRLVGTGADRATIESSTLVFDEVDAGIGGSAAAAVGEALADVARYHQVIVVTHLAQVAAAASTQIGVSKAVVDGTTVAAAEPLTGADRVAEVARMLSGDFGGTAAEQHAAELLAHRA
ncbi:DNA repair protein RecN [soil metagenome]